MCFLFPCEFEDQIEAETQFYQNEEEIESVAAVFVREFCRIYENNYRENQGKENCENYESYEFWESFIYVAFVSKVQSEHLYREPKYEENHAKQSENISFKDKALVELSWENKGNIE